MSTISFRRVLAVTLGLSLTGAVCGAILGAIALLVELAVLRELSTTPGLWRLSLLVGAGFGAVIGAVLAPLIAWIFLRRVSFARAIGQTALGLLAGVAIGTAIQPAFTVFFGVAGFVAAAILLWVRTGRRATANRPPDES